MSLRELAKIQSKKMKSFKKNKKRMKFFRSILKLYTAEMAWKIVTNSKSLNFFIKFLYKTPIKLRFVLIKILRKIYSRFFRIFDALQQGERAFHVTRIMRIAFKSRFSRPNSKEKRFYVQACFKVGALQRLCKENIYSLDCPDCIFTIGKAYLLSGEFQKADKLINLALEFDKSNTEILRYAGIVQVLLGNYEKAENIFKTRIFLNRSLLVPHQNLAAKYHLKDFFLSISDLKDSGNHQIYDQLNYMGEHFIHYGKLSEAMYAYKCALLHQKKLKQKFNLPSRLISYLQKFSNFKKSQSIAILPTEWVTQIGHIAALDIFLKIEHYERKRECNYVLLAPKSLVANHHYLSYWKRYFCIVEDDDMIRQFIPYQRQLGESFIPFLKDSGEIEPWTRTGARAQFLWHQENKAPLLQFSQEDQIFGRQKLHSMGLPANAWFVALHVREGSFYNEIGESSDHRNARIQDYIDAIKEIISRGGWVIRMGDPNMTPFPKMKNVIDYAHSNFKSPRMDVCLIAMARLFIGTTSGLTATAFSFDRPSLLVNIISSDWQFWNSKTHFLPKMIFDSRSKRVMTLGELYLSENRDLLFKKELMNRKKWEVIVNSRDDILEAVKYKLDVLEQKEILNLKQQELVHCYKNHMSKEPYMFGAAHIVPNFLEKHPYLISPTSQKQNFNSKVLKS